VPRLAGQRHGNARSCHRCQCRCRCRCPPRPCPESTRRGAIRAASRQRLEEV
jgi:hypothetical protein